MQNAQLIGLSSQMALGREIEVIANNMANVTTTGFKARSTRFQEYLMPKASADLVTTSRFASSPPGLFELRHTGGSMPRLARSAI